MSWLTVRLWRRSERGAVRLWRRSERGAVAIIAATVVGFGTMVGAAAITVDVGQLYLEREEVQGGADAAAVRVAKGCVASPSTCGSQATTAKSYADRNAKDGKSRVSICGTGQGMTACAAPGSTITACHGTRPSLPVRYVEVTTKTETASGGTLLPPSVSQALAGGNYSGTEVTACARASWGAPTTPSGGGLAVTLSQAEWACMTQNGVNYAPAPPGTGTAGNENFILLHGTTDVGCPGSGGLNAPGNFGWLDQVSGTSDCITPAPVNNTLTGDNGNNIPDGCEEALADAVSHHPKVFTLPVYDTVSGSGSHTSYHIVGYSAFVITGYFLGNSRQQDSWLSGRSGCPGTSGGSGRCIWGYFTTGLMPGSSTPGTGTSFGVSVVSLSG